MSSLGGRLHREPFLERHHFLAFLVVASAALGVATLSVKQPERVRGVQDLGTRLLGPLARVGSGASGAAGDAWGGVSSTWKARRELEKAQARLEELKLVESDRDALAEENAQLRDMLDLAQRMPTRVVPARVLYQERGPDWILLVDKGSDDGVAEDQAVIAPEGVVGKVLAVTPGIARVQCVVDGDAGIAVRVGPQGRQANAVVADGSGATCRLRHVELLEDIQVGDAVVTSGQDLIYPSGLLVGTVQAVEPRGLDREIVVLPAVDFTRLHHVLIVVSADASVKAARKERADSGARGKRRGT